MSKMGEMKLALRKSDIEDWYTIELAEHENRMWLEQTAPGCMSLRYSGRISDADVEGTAEEMKAIAEAIEQRSYAEFRRCAVKVHEYDRVEFWSPRNSQKSGVVSMAVANDLARLIRERLR